MKIPRVIFVENRFMSAEMDPVGLWLYQEYARKWLKDRTEDTEHFVIWMGSHRKGNRTEDMVYDSGRQESIIPNSNGLALMGAPC